ncbi:phosphatidylinositol-specific phospholipase C/glycerophosphodiester phosphodiesterase family protein [Mucilaginibacter puniceus]
MHKISLVAAVIIAYLIYHSCAFAQPLPLPNAFAHNDYWHKHPLYDALDNGYTNIEADVFLRGKDLVVAHINPYFKAHRKLEKLYLMPLLEQVINNNGQVYTNYNEPITLLIDIKSDANETYNALKPLLEKYKSILTSYDNGAITERAVTIVLSGHKPYDMLKNESSRLVFIDKDLRKIMPDATANNIFTMASCKYSKLIKWNGYGSLPEDQKQKLVNYVNEAHSRGERVRLWASPENKIVWKELLKCGVDLINTNQLVALKKFLISISKSVHEDLPGLSQLRYAAID